VPGAGPPVADRGQVDAGEPGEWPVERDRSQIPVATAALGPLCVQWLPDSLPSTWLSRISRRGVNTEGSRFCGHEVGNLRCPGYCSITIMAATWMKARKLAAFFS
jgi:hypothetical protein